ncbi:MAG: helix-turn-helix domain-containing protein, partial [Pseudomonadota bacterium]
LNLSGYARRLREFVVMIEYLSMDDIPKRVAKYILRNSRGGQLDLSISKKEWAQFIGTTPETLSRILTSLKKNKVITEKNKIFTITNYEKLKKMIGK